MEKEVIHVGKVEFTSITKKRLKTVRVYSRHIFDAIPKQNSENSFFQLCNISLKILVVFNFQG